MEFSRKFLNRSFTLYFYINKRKIYIIWCSYIFFKSPILKWFLWINLLVNKHCEIRILNFFRKKCLHQSLTNTIQNQIHIFNILLVLFSNISTPRFTRDGNLISAAIWMGPQVPRALVLGPQGGLNYRRHSTPAGSDV